MVIVDTRETASGAPWIDLDSQSRVDWRSDDIILSVPAKCGTNWLMNIVHQLRTGGDDAFADIHVEIPWLEFVEHPGQTADQRLARWAAMPSDRPRIFKTHSGPPLLPYVEPGGDRPGPRYVVMLRNPEEAVVSLRPFLERHSQAFLDMWQVPREALVRDDFERWFDEIAVAALGFDAALFEFLANWWPLRHASNVLLLHYGDLIADLGRTVRELAGWLDLAPSATRWPAILERCSFAWMKAHQHKFELRGVAPVPVLDPGAMVRTGRLGAARDEGVDDRVAAHLRARGQARLDAAALDWHYRGGPLPG